MCQELRLALTAVLFAASISAQGVDPGKDWDRSKNNDGRWNDVSLGPFLASVIDIPGEQVRKAVSFDMGHACLCWDTQTASLKAVWTGEFLSFSSGKWGVVNSPKIAGELAFISKGNSWGDSSVRWKQLTRHDGVSLLRYTVDGVKVTEIYSMAFNDGRTSILREFNISAHSEPLKLRIASDLKNLKTLTSAKGLIRRKGSYNDRTIRIAIQSQLPFSSNGLEATIEQTDRVGQITVTYEFDSDDKSHALPKDHSEWLNVKSTVSKDDASPYVIDTIGVPFDNPDQALCFLTGIDFLSNGDAVVSALHGDVWLVRGIDAELKNVRWKRFATGLHQPIGVKVIDDRIYVLCRDQITILEDTNNDDLADRYINFNNSGETLPGHKYAAGLETDSKGNFYYIRENEGVARVSRDGSKHEVIATGFRNPIGLGVGGPNDLITGAPQEGVWTPATSLIAVKEGGHYGFNGPQVTADRPKGYDDPLCWMPRIQDNSAGGQTWVTSDKWGPLKNSMLHFSYGQCAMMLVPHEITDQTIQGGTIRFPLLFESGVMRGRFSPFDGQLYVTGLCGWQTAAAKDGCLQRVRYTGKPVDMPTAIRVTKTGLEIDFTNPLDLESASDPENYAIEVWNYKYSKEYGSPDFRPSAPTKFGHDEIYVDAVKLKNGGKTIELELEEIFPVMQMQIEYRIASKDGRPVKQTLFNTINVVPAD